MGLQEKRALKEFETNVYPALLEQIKSAAAFPVTVDVAWSGMEQDGLGNLYAESLEKVYFTPLIQALKNICVDDLGKDLLKKNLKKIVIKNSVMSTFTFEGGVLTVGHEPATNVDYVDDRRKDIQTALEAKL